MDMLLSEQVLEVLSCWENGMSGEDLEQAVGAHTEPWQPIYQLAQKHFSIPQRVTGVNG